MTPATKALLAMNPFASTEQAAPETPKKPKAPKPPKKPKRS